jgi:hypothetical protein
MWHDIVVDELLALRWAWLDAHYGANPSGAKACDWRDKYRELATARINNELKTCTLSQHAEGGEKRWRPVNVPGVDQLAEVATWWATDRRAASPLPSNDMLAQEQAARVVRDD